MTIRPGLPRGVRRAMAVTAGTAVMLAGIVVIDRDHFGGVGLSALPDATGQPAPTGPTGGSGGGSGSGPAFPMQPPDMPSPPGGYNSGSYPAPDQGNGISIYNSDAPESPGSQGGYQQAPNNSQQLQPANGTQPPNYDAPLHPSPAPQPSAAPSPAPHSAAPQQPQPSQPQQQSPDQTEQQPQKQPDSTQQLNERQQQCQAVAQAFGNPVDAVASVVGGGGYPTRFGGAPKTWRRQPPAPPSPGGCSECPQPKSKTEGRVIRQEIEWWGQRVQLKNPAAMEYAKRELDTVSTDAAICGGAGALGLTTPVGAGLFIGCGLPAASLHLLQTTIDNANADGMCMNFDLTWLTTFTTTAVPCSLP